MLPLPRQHAVVEGHIAFNDKTIERPSLGICVEPPAELVEHDVVADKLLALVVLRINGMAVAPVAGVALPPVEVNQAAVYLRVSGRAPKADAHARIMDQHVDDLDVGTVDVHPTPRVCVRSGELLHTSKPQYQVQAPLIPKGGVLDMVPSIVARSPGNWRTRIGWFGLPVSVLLNAPR